MISSFDTIPARERIIVALDCNIEKTLELANVLHRKATWLKVGMTLFYANGPAIIYALKEYGFKVFLDLKFHDIPHQVEGAATSAALSGADMLTMHTAGGLTMMKAAQKGVTKAANDNNKEVPITLGITVLTSMDDSSLKDIGVDNVIPDQVTLLADLAKNAGISGVVASPQEASMLRSILGPDAYIVTPGVRPQGAEIGDQSRIATPAQAFNAGASHIVIGRPITEANDPVRAFEDIVQSL